MCVRRAAIAAALFVATLVVAVPRAHADDPTLGYHTITTPHFFVHYHDGIEALANEVSARLPGKRLRARA